MNTTDKEFLNALQDRIISLLSNDSLDRIELEGTATSLGYINCLLDNDLPVSDEMLNEFKELNEALGEYIQDDKYVDS